METKKKEKKGNKTKRKRLQKNNKPERIFNNCGAITKGVTYM